MNNMQITTPSATSNVPWSPKQFADHLAVLLSLKTQGDECFKKYYAPGRKELHRILGNVYDEYLKIEQSADPYRIYTLLRNRLRSDNIKTHADTPNSGVLLRIVLPTLDPSRLSKFARAMDSAYVNKVKAGGLSAYISEVGGIERIRVDMIPAYSIEPMPKATTKVRSSKSPVQLPDVTSAVTLDNDDAIGYGDELWELLERRKTQPLLSLAPITSGQLDVLVQPVNEHIVLIAQVINGQLHVLEQVPYFEGAIVQSLQTLYASTADFVAANSQSPATLTDAQCGDGLDGDDLVTEVTECDLAQAPA